MEGLLMLKLYFGSLEEVVPFVTFTNGRELIGQRL